MAQSGVGTGAVNATVAALRFFFRVTLKRYAIVEHTAFIHEPRKLPVVLSPDEMARLLERAASGLRFPGLCQIASVASMMVPSRTLRGANGVVVPLLVAQRLARDQLVEGQRRASGRLHSGRSKIGIGGGASRLRRVQYTMLDFSPAMHELARQRPGSLAQSVRQVAVDFKRDKGRQGWANSMRSAANCRSPEGSRLL